MFSYLNRLHIFFLQDFVNKYSSEHLNEKLCMTKQKAGAVTLACVEVMNCSISVLFFLLLTPVLSD